MDFSTYTTVFKISYFVFIVPTILVFISALLSAKEMGGSLGQGVKKIAAGSIINTALIMTYLALERGQEGILSDQIVSLFFLVGGIFGATLLVSGFLQLYKISKKFKLFTP